MHNAPRLLVDLAMVLGVGAMTSVLFRWLRWPVVLGYVLAGVIVGPHVPLLLVADQDNIHTLGELGVTLLMFSLGLEFSLGRLRLAGPSALLMAAIQAGAAASLGYLASLSFGWTTTESMFVGAALSIGSTMLIAKLFSEHEPPKALRDMVLSMLVVQDLIAIILLTALTATARAGSADAAPIGRTLLQLGLFLAVVFSLGLFIVPRFLRWVADHMSAETLLVVCCGLCFVLAVGAASMGLSVALGAFLAGMLAAESGRARAIDHLVVPLKDLFTTIFFVAVGMLIDPRYLLSLWGPILLLSGLVVVANTLFTTLGGLFAGHSFGLSLRGGMALSQIGEFGYIILGTGVVAGVVRPEIYSGGVAVGVVTAALTPILMRVAEPFSQALEARIPEPILARMSLYRAWAEGLRGRDLRREPGTSRQAFHLLGDAVLLVAFTLGSHWLYQWIQGWLEGAFHWGKMLANTSVAALLGVVWAILIYSLVRHGRRMARDLAVLAPIPIAEGSPRLGRHVLAGGLRIALFLMTALPLLAILQPFVPKGPLFLVALTVFAGTLIVQVRRAVPSTHSITEDLLARFRRDI
ncbi:MAG: cation:proton antiporter [Holophaga sp.]|nr:cation:proton antiporter [Holophaga sp.]